MHFLTRLLILAPVFVQSFQAMSIYQFVTTYIDIDVPKEFPKWEDEEVNSYCLMANPYSMMALVSCYLLFVSALGPRLMRDRKPFSLKYPMMFYNVIQVVYNIGFIWLVLRENEAMRYFMDEACYPNIPTKNRYLRTFALHAIWIWLMSKVSDLLDTVFFVLRKKQSQVTGLHIYHHTHMVVMTWVYLKYVRGEQGIVVCLVNSTVHVIMYSYYFLSALGPHVQKYLWWKKYITRLQLFLGLTTYYLSLIVFCHLPPAQFAYNLYFVLQTVLFTGLFLNFYFKSYIKSTKNMSGSSNSCSANMQPMRNTNVGLNTAFEKSSLNKYID